MRPLFFPAAFWFEATFVSDQKEQEILPVAIDLHHGRQVRHLDRLLDRGRLAETPSLPLAETRHPGLASAYPIARDRVIPNPRGSGQHPAARARGPAGPAARTHRPLLQRPSS